jgi:hypothetical protein
MRMNLNGRNHWHYDIISISDSKEDKDINWHLLTIKVHGATADSIKITWPSEKSVFL